MWRENSTLFSTIAYGEWGRINIMPANNGKLAGIPKTTANLGEGDKGAWFYYYYY